MQGAYDPNYYRWMKLQLHPNLVPQNPNLATALGSTVLNPLTLPTSHTSTGSTLQDIQKEQIVRALLSTRQIQEVMARFWDTHFNTSYFSVRSALINQNYTTGAVSADEYAVWLERDDRNWYRDNAFGTFLDMLRRTTDSPAMMLYLNQNVNRAPTPNQNYARELLELYTMGPNYEPTGLANYGQTDIVGVAEVLSGWNLQNTGPLPHTSTFIAGNHVNNPQSLFTSTVSPANFSVGLLGNGMGQKDELLIWLANAEETKDFICRKLVRWFVADIAGDPGVENALITDMKSAWGRNGNIQEVLWTIFNTAPFFRPQYRWQRARTPFEKVIWWSRTWDANLTRFDGMGIDLNKIEEPFLGLQRIGELPFQFPSPDGFPPESNEQPGSSVTLETYRFNQQIMLSLMPDDLAAPVMNYYPFHPSLLFHPTVFNVLSGPLAPQQGIPERGRDRNAGPRLR